MTLLLLFAIFFTGLNQMITLKTLENLLSPAIYPGRLGDRYAGLGTQILAREKL